MTLCIILSTTTYYFVTHYETLLPNSTACINVLDSVSYIRGIIRAVAGAASLTDYIACIHELIDVGLILCTEAAWPCVCVRACVFTCVRGGVRSPNESPACHSTPHSRFSLSLFHKWGLTRSGYLVNAPHANTHVCTCRRIYAHLHIHACLSLRDKML